MEYPPADPQNVLSFLIPSGDIVTPEAPAASVAFETVLNQHAESVIDAAAVSAVEPGNAEMKSCPKCGALNGRRSKECYSCHVLFERLEGLPQDPSLRAQPSLVRKWKSLLENFTDMNLHDDFIRSCRELDALKFAVLKYEELKAAQGGDELCDQMLARIQGMMMVSLSQKPVHKDSVEPVMSFITRNRKYFYWGPYGLSALMILIGMMNLGHRNLIGVGVALACMTSGLIVMIRGRISWSDFVD
ncbi:hypothetical protein [Bdellovibrio sp. HCB2-146]|uniref:hypothetical protein n=1 Tax=Bdellovibrio sp. HCB2-146 TaxID=3394362 RepID=UPI0039BC8FB7